MSIGDSQNEGMILEAITHHLVPERCGACATAFTAALCLAEKVADGSISTDDAERRYDLNLGGKCILGVVELDDVGHCLVSDSSVVLPKKPQPVL